MRRTTAAALGTLIGTTLLVAAKYGAPSATAGTATAITAGNPAADSNSTAAGSAPPDGTSASAGAAPGISGTPAPPGAAPSGTAHTTAPPQPGRTTPAVAGGGGGGGGGTTTAPPPPSCSNVTGSGVGVASPGIGTVTVTIKVCNGAISSATSTQDQSDWSNNTAALPALNALVPQNYKTNISAIHYSGATLTSHAYQSSLQSAMSKAGI